MNLLGGMQALSNFGTGYLQGQQTDTQNTAMNKMNQLALQDAQLKQDQEKLSMKQQQLLSDKAMEVFNPMGPPAGAPPTGGQPVPPASMPGAGAPMADTSQATAGTDPSEKITELANFAASKGDLAHANELWTNAANLKTAQFEQQQKQSAIQVAEMKRQQMHYSLAAQYAGTVEDSPEGFSQWKMAMLSDPTASPEERQNIANMPYHPGVLDKIKEAGLTASQQATAKLKEQEMAEKKRVDDLQESHRQRQDLERTAHDRAIEQAKKVQTKVGAAAHAPTETQLDNVTQVVKDNMPGVDVSGPEFDQARRSIAARAAQIVQGNRAVTFTQAAAMAASEAKKNGEFEKVTSPDTHAKIFGHNIPFTGQSAATKTSFKEKGAIPDEAIPFTGQAKSELVPGKFYKTGNGVMQWTGTGWKPQS